MTSQLVSPQSLLNEALLVNDSLGLLHRGKTNELLTSAFVRLLFNRQMGMGELIF